LMKSAANKVSMSKAEIDRRGKELTEAQRKEVAAVNAGRKVAETFLADLRDQVKKPADDWEAKEAARITAHKEGLAKFDEGRVDAMSEPDLIQSMIDKAKAFHAGRVWEEYAPQADALLRNCLTKWQADLDAANLRIAQAAELEALRAEKAALLGYSTYAHYKLDDTMAKAPDSVRSLLDQVWEKGRARALQEAADLQEMADSEGANFKIAAHDWRYYSSKVRAAKFAIDDAQVKPYFELENIRAAAFDVAGRLFDLTFEERKGLVLYHPDVRAFEVKDAQGAHVALFVADDFARASKRSGAWMTAFRSQQKLDGDVRPIIVNVLNVAKPGAGEPALLSLDEARTLFHEFGHALHGMLSDVLYPRISGTSVSSDFVELPSQLFEHWLTQPDVLRRFARHVKTGEAMPEDLLERILAMRTFNQGFATVEYCSSAYVDMDFHALAHPVNVDSAAFTRKRLEAISMPAEIAMRHATSHFAHVFSGEGYSAGYYSYLWSEVLDADAFDAFLETGDAFDPAVAQRLHEFIYSAGGRREPDDAYIAFRGRLPTPDALLRKRGLAEAAE